MATCGEESAGKTQLNWEIKLFICALVKVPGYWIKFPILRKANVKVRVGSIPFSFTPSNTNTHRHTHTRSLPQLTSHSHCVFNPGLFCGRIPHEDSCFCGSRFFFPPRACHALLSPLLFSICMEIPPCASVFVCCEHAPQQSACASICTHTHSYRSE